jgi:dynein heavy chain 1, cytosolic
MNGEWVEWSNKVPQIEVDKNKIGGSDVVIPTIDTIRHEALLYTWLAEHKPLLLCGPPGSGKTMTLFSALRSLPQIEVVGINFSSATTPELLLRTFDHYCEYRKTSNGIILSPKLVNKWLVMFCDEINLPDEDKYSTQRIIMFIRQCIEQNGFYRKHDHTWIKLERIQFVGACNPPTDPGRKPLNLRFLRHVPLIYVDYPGETSLCQIYGTFNRAMLQHSNEQLRDPQTLETLTQCMVDFFLKTQDKFTSDIQPHYVYSPREMSRWVRGINEVVKTNNEMNIQQLIRIWAHEGLRLFHDRLIYDHEREWTEESINQIAIKHFSRYIESNLISDALERPIFYSNWLNTDDYRSVSGADVCDFLNQKLKLFCDEELDVKLVLFESVVDYVLRIDRVFRQIQGHLLLIGISGCGKTILTRFVAWLNGMSVYQVKVHNNYTMVNFDDDLRCVLKRCGVKNEKIAFLIDESKVFDSSFLERINTLLANGEVPGLFEGDDYTSLMHQCRESALKQQGIIIETDDHLYKWFTKQIMKNLHIVFTMNPSEDGNGLKGKTSTSPALFNRCVLNWFGDWSQSAYYQVAKEFTLNIPIESSSTDRNIILNSFVYIHQSVPRKIVPITPRYFLDFIDHFVTLYNQKKSQLMEEQSHLNKGLNKMIETVEQVEELQSSLSVKRSELEFKNNEANSKLKQMVIDQQIAEKTKIDSQNLQQLLIKQSQEIDEKSKIVMNDLSRVEPAIIEAQQAVKSIKKQNLVELKNLANPPSVIKLALESICLLMNQETTDWKSIRSIIMKEGFINSIINFQTDDITKEIKNKMITKYIKNPEYSYEKVNRASVACGPLVKWAIAQIEYADILNKVEPLRNELTQLEDTKTSNKLKSLLFL